MQKYIRTCLSLDQETIKKINQLTWTLGAPGTQSGIVREAIKFLYDHVESWKAEREKHFGWRK